ncbi:hypothetical protein JW758_04395 [Candidatus Peregrinibacteria bacterium]|nr:hypothetical protein [Candidatus Peregrinibacteria bacterium]
MSEYKSPSRREIMEAYGDRLLYKPERINREDLELDENLTEKDLVGKSIVEDFENAKPSDSNIYKPNLSDRFSDEEMSGYDYYTSFKKPLSTTMLRSGSNPITLFVSTLKDRYKRKGKQEETEEAIHMDVLKGNLLSKNVDELVKAYEDIEKFMGILILIKKPDGVFDIPHRYIPAKYRGTQNKSGERLGDILIKGAEQIVQNSANEKGKTQSAVLTVGKLDALMWVVANGYKPKTEQDKERLEKILNADESLVIVDDLFIWEKNKWKEGINPHQNRDDSFLVTFEKVFEPNSGAMAENTRHKIKTGLGIS